MQQAIEQHVSNVVWAAATLQLQLEPKQWQQLLQASDRVLAHATPQHVANTLWAAATLGMPIPEPQLQQFSLHFQRVLQEADPQNISNTLWAVATMQQQLPPAQLQLLLQRLVELLPQVNSQTISNTLWAVATMQQRLPPAQLQQLLQRFQETVREADPQAVANTLSACGKLHDLPLQLLSALEQHPRRLQAILAVATPQALSNMAWACGQLGYKGKLLPAAVLHQAVKLLQGERKGRFLMQNLCNLCWCAAVLDMQQHVSLALQLAAATKQLWRDVALEHVQQLYQAHIWLVDIQLPAPGQGLSGTLCRLLRSRAAGARSCSSLPCFQGTGACMSRSTIAPACAVRIQGQLTSMTAYQSCQAACGCVCCKCRFQSRLGVQGVVTAWHTVCASCGSECVVWFV